MHSKNRSQTAVGIMVIMITAAIWAVSTGVGQPGTKEPIQKGDQISEGSSSPSYKTVPPTSGPYYPSTASCKIYDTELPIPQLMHNVRNGNIALLYKRDIDSITWGKIRALNNTLIKDGWFLAAPYENMPKKLSVIAWGWHLDLDDYDEKQILDFYDAHKENGIEHIPCML